MEPQGTRVQTNTDQTGATNRPGAGPMAFALEIVDGDELTRICPRQWDELSAKALDANPFYGRRYLSAGLATIDRDSKLRALTIKTGAGQLVGFFPYRLSRMLPQVAVGANNLYQMSGQPLIHRDYGDAVIGAWLGAIESGSIPKRWRFPHLDFGSHFARLCRRHAGSAAFETIVLGGYSRARLTRLPDGFEGHVQKVMSKRRAKDIQRTLRRLEELGTVRFERATDTATVRQRVEDFFAMEHAGWKGEAGTSFLSDPQHAQFFRDALVGNEAVSIDSLLLDGQPIAVSINLAAGGTVFTPKCAYDEAYRRFSPGLALEYLVIQAFYESGDAVVMDAATTVDGHLVQALWNEEQAMGTLLLGPKGFPTQLAARAHVAASQARRVARDLVGQPVLALARRALRRIDPELLRRLTSLGQTATCMLLYV